VAYVTPATLQTEYGTGELLQASASSDPAGLVSEALLALTITGGDRSEYAADEIAAANLVLINVQRACNQANARIDSTIRARWPGIETPVTTTTDLQRIGCWLARYMLRDLLHDEPQSTVWRRYADAIKELGDLVRGMTDLGITPEIVGTVANAAAPIVNAPPTVFTDALLERMP
jgi:phage gp36-like protein